TTTIGNRFTWTAPATAQSVNVTFAAGGQEVPTTMQVRAPHTVSFTRAGTPDAFGPGIAGAGMHLMVSFGPYAVSFQNLQWREVAGPGSQPHGYFEGRSLPEHTPERAWLNIDSSNRIGGDHASFSGIPGPWGRSGSYRWVIPNEYRVPGESAAQHFTDVNQICTLDGPPNAGRVTVSKADTHGGGLTASTTRAITPVAAAAAPAAAAPTTRIGGRGTGFAGVGTGEGSPADTAAPADKQAAPSGKPPSKADEPGKPNASGSGKQKAADDTAKPQQGAKPPVKPPAKPAGKGAPGAVPANANAPKQGADKNADGADLGVAAKGGDNKAVVAKPVASAVPVTAPTVSPVPQLSIDAPKVTKSTSDKWVKDTGRTPEAHFAQIQSALAAFQSEVAAKQAELMASSDTESTKVVGDIKAKVDTFKTSAIGAGHNRVAAAFDGMGKTLDASEKKAIADIATHKKTGAAQITSAQATQSKALADKFAAAKKADDGHRAKAKPLIVATINTFAAAIKKDTVTKAKADALAIGDAAAASKKPESFDGTSSMEGGLQSLTEDVAKQKLKDHGKQLGDKYESQLKGFGENVETKADEMITKSLEPAKLELTLALDVADKASKGGMDVAAKTATSNLESQEKTATKAVVDAKASTQKRVADEKKTALELADKSGAEFADNTTAAGTELSDRIKKKVAEDAAGYGKLVGDIQKGLKHGGPFKFEAIEPKLVAAKAQLAEMHAGNVAGLTKMVTDGTKDLGESLGKLEITYSDAIKEREADAKKLDGSIATEMGKGAADMGAALGSIATTFSTTAQAETKKIDSAVAEFNVSATTLLTNFDKQVKEQLTLANQKLDAELAANLVPKKFEEDANPEIRKAVGAKQKALGKDASGLRDAMDGWGTDENKIYGIMRKCSYGEIEYLEASYNEHYPERAKGANRPLRADLDDEMSGNELKIALAYLDHDRKAAIKLELDDSCHWYNDDEARIEEVLRSASEEEITYLNTDASAKKIVADTRSALGGCDLDTMDALLDQSIKTKEERATKANAIRLYDAMHGVGTDEAKVKQILEGAATKEERDALRAQFNKYATSDKNFYASAQEGWLGNQGKDALDSALDEEFSGGEKTLVQVMAKSDRDEQELKMAKAIDAVDGIGTNEEALFDSLDDDKYNEKWVLAKEAAKSGDPAAIAALKKLEEEHESELDKKLKGLGSEGVQSLIDGDMSKSQFTYQELLDGKYKDPARGVFDKAAAMTRLKSPQIPNPLEWMVAQRKLQTGAAEPELLLAYACYGDGTNEDLIKKVLAPGGDVKSRGAIKEIRDAFQRVWSEPLTARDELEACDFSFPSPGGLLEDELSGKDWNQIRVFLCGKPETPEQLKYVGKLQAKFATSGLIGGALMDLGEAVGFTEAKTTLQNTDKRFDAKYAELDAAFKADPANKGKDFGKAKLSEIIAIGGEQLERYAEYLAQDADAYSKALSSVVDTLCTVLEIVGGIILTVVTAGTASPVLAAVIGNLIIAGTTIALKAAALGDNYGAAELGADVIKAIGTAGFAGLGEVKALKTLTDAAGKKAAGALFTTIKDGVNVGGGRLVGTTIEFGPKAVENVSKIVAAGTKNVIISTGQEIYNTVTDEKTYDKKLGEALWGEDSLGARLVKGIPKAFVEGAVKQYIDEAAGTSNMDNKGRMKHPLGNMIGNAMSDMGSNIAGFFVYVDNYKDAEGFWKELLKSTATKTVGGFFTGYGMHKARAKKTARDFLNGEMTPEGLKEMLKVLDHQEQKELADFVKKHGTPAQFDAMPEEFKTATGKPPVVVDPTTTTKKPVGEVDPLVADAKKKQDELDAAAAKKKQDEHDAATKKAKDDADAEAARLKKEPAKKEGDEEVDGKKKPVVHDEEEAKKKAGVKEDEEAKKKVVADEDPTKKAAVDDEHAKKAALHEPQLDASGNIAAKKPGVKLPDAGDRQNVPHEVPVDKAELLALVKKLHPDLIAKYEAKAKSDSGPAFDALIAELETLKPGSLGKVKGDDEKTAVNAKRDAEILKTWTDTAGEQSKKFGNEADLRVIYNDIEKNYFHVWEKQIAHLPKETQARMLHMYREELKDYIRTLMSDDKSKRVLYLRDRAVYGSERGPRFDALVDNALADQKVNGDPEAAYQKVMDDAKRSNKGVNKNTTGSEDGLKKPTTLTAEEQKKAQAAVEEQVRHLDELTKKIAASSGEDQVKHQAELDALKKDPTWKSAVELHELFEKAPVAKQQEGDAKRRAEIHLGGDKPAEKPTVHEAGLRGELDEIWELRGKLGKPEDAPGAHAELKAKLAAKQADLDAKLKDPSQKEALLDPHVVFALAREASTKAQDHSAALKDFLSTNIEGVRAAQDQSRQGANPELRAKREVFERALALAVLNDGAIKKQVDANLDTMCEKALDYITKSRAEHERAEGLAALGMKSSSGYAGAVLAGDDTAANSKVMMDVLKSGNARERMIALGKFAELVAGDMLNSPSKFDKVAAASANGAGKPGEFTAADVEAYRTRMEQFKKDKGYTGAQGEAVPGTGDFLKPLSTEKKGSQKEYQTTKGQEMDTKLPSVHVDDAESFFPGGGKEKKPGSGLT
ncbi:MAG: hypothetical protein NT062_36615, partial [Proteobacteria bacterium]|nr:hypothetical protein [Pseudomonadota bacterium]